MKFLLTKSWLASGTTDSDHSGKGPLARPIQEAAVHTKSYGYVRCVPEIDQGIGPPEPGRVEPRKYSVEPFG